MNSDLITSGPPYTTMTTVSVRGVRLRSSDAPGAPFLQGLRDDFSCAKVAILYDDQTGGVVDVDQLSVTSAFAAAPRGRSRLWSQKDHAVGQLPRAYFASQAQPPTRRR